MTRSPSYTLDGTSPRGCRSRAERLHQGIHRKRRRGQATRLKLVLARVTQCRSLAERRHRRVLKSTRPGVVRNGDNEGGGLARGRLVSKLGKRWRSAGVV